MKVSLVIKLGLCLILILLIVSIVQLGKSPNGRENQAFLRITDVGPQIYMLTNDVTAVFGKYRASTFPLSPSTGKAVIRIIKASHYAPSRKRGKGLALGGVVLRDAQPIFSMTILENDLVSIDNRKYYVGKKGKLLLNILRDEYNTWNKTQPK